MRRRFLPDAAPSRGMLKKCSEVRMVTGAFDAVHLYEQFDAVSMIQVIGHLRDPLYAMQILQDCSARAAMWLSNMEQRKLYCKSF